jgi:hypothetical protein
MKPKGAQQTGQSRPRKNPSKPAQQSSARDRAFQVLADMRRNPALRFTQAARNREIDPRIVRKMLPSALQKDSSGRVRARTSDRYRQTLYIPSPKPGMRIEVPTKNSKERQLVGRWMDALNAAGRGDFSKLKNFPRKQVVGGVRLKTGTQEIQRILAAMAEEEAPYEGLYRSIAKPS